MRERILTILRCVHCGCEIKIAKVYSTVDDQIEYGLLKCVQCQLKYPIVVGIPIIGSPEDRLNVWAETTSEAAISGVRIVDLIIELEKNSLERAFSLLLNPTGLGGSLSLALAPKLQRAVTFPEEYVPPPRRLVGQKLQNLNIVPSRLRRRLGRWLLPIVRPKLAKFLVQYNNSLSAYSVIDLYYRLYSESEMANYFFYRFGQPRHLAALCLATVLSEVPGPVLDLACGAGHLTHYLSSMRPSSMVVGIDRDFFRLFLAHKYIAPAADFLCTPIAYPLPFPKSCLGSVFCSDAFHLFPRKASTVNEMRRVLMKYGLILLARVGNLAIDPTEGYELTVDGYDRLFSSIPHVLIGEDQLIDNYLEKKGPNLGRPRDIKEQKWLSIVATDRKDLFTNHKMFEDWPHASGRLVINPIYMPDQDSSRKGQRFLFRFPSDWYAFEDARYEEYAPSEWIVPQDVLAAIRRRERIPLMEKLIQNFVIIGVPEKYW